VPSITCVWQISMSATNGLVSHGAAGPADWIMAAIQDIEAGKITILAMITSHAGSTPRDAGTWMLVSERQILGTLGGGQLEKISEDTALEMIKDIGGTRRSSLNCLLGPDAKQCCGGAINLTFEKLDIEALGWLTEARNTIQRHSDGAVLFSISDSNIEPRVVVSSSSITPTKGMHLQKICDNRPQLFIFGGGHVGRAICAIASQLPLRVTVIDSRMKILDLIPQSLNINVVHTISPVEFVDCIPVAASVLIMTHSHELDYDLCCTILQKNKFRYVGLIGSQSKAARFRRRLHANGLSPEMLHQLTSPIGSCGPTGKEPGIIGLSVLLEVLIKFGRRTHIGNRDETQMWDLATD